MICTVISQVNPLDLRINNRYTDVRKVPPGITKAFKQLVADAQRAAEQQMWKDNLHPKARIKMTFTYNMPHRRADVDGPSKRAQDAVSTGLGFNDNRVDSVTHIRGPVGEPGIVCVIETLDHHDPEHWEIGDADWTVGVGDNYPIFHTKADEYNG